MQHYLLGENHSVDLRDLSANARVRASIESIEALQKDASLQIITGTSPLPIKMAICEKLGLAIEWVCVKTGPNIWHAQVRRTV